ncbi:MAG: lysophospholipase [Actinomycetota bacterium]|nr:lysophospholipase [Actinomycetota bacterium]
MGAAVLVLALAACTAPSGHSSDAAGTGCRPASCFGELAGAPYEIAVPARWNGTLLLFSHGYRDPRPGEGSRKPQLAPSSEVRGRLLAEGYALAGSAYATNGWAVEDGVRAGEDLHARFRREVGEPRRVYVWGESMGGLVTALLAERHPDWVSGALPACAAVAGTTANFDLALDVAYAVRTLLAPDLKLAGFSSVEEGASALAGARAAVERAGQDPASASRISLAAALADAPGRTATEDGSTPATRLRADGEALLSALFFSTVARAELEQRLGGNPSGNLGVDYAARISAAERERIEALEPGAVDRLLTQLAAGERVPSDAAARSRADRLGPGGRVADPTVLLHTAADPLVLAQNVTVFRHRAEAAGSGDLVLALHSVWPASYASVPGGRAPYGAGHCAFGTDEHLAALRVLDDWVGSGRRPTASAVQAALSGSPGLRGDYDPGPWPGRLPETCC